MTQLALFELETPAQPQADLVARARAAMGHNFANFRWWCFHSRGEARAMCEAVLWRSKNFTREDARAVVEELAKMEPGLMWPHPTPEGVS